jgi:hypothetical protein
MRPIEGEGGFATLAGAARQEVEHRWQNANSTQELLTHHLQYEIDILRWTFVRLHNRTLD